MMGDVTEAVDLAGPDLGLCRRGLGRKGLVLRGRRCGGGNRGGRRGGGGYRDFRLRIFFGLLPIEAVGIGVRGGEDAAVVAPGIQVGFLHALGEVGAKVRGAAIADPILHLGGAAPLVAPGLPVRRNLEMDAPVIGGVVGAVGGVRHVAQVIVCTGIAGLQLKGQILELTFQAGVIIAPAGTEATQAGKAVVMPLAQAEAGAVVAPDCGGEAGFGLHVGQDAAGGGGVHAQLPGYKVEDAPLCGQGACPGGGQQGKQEAEQKHQDQNRRETAFLCHVCHLEAIVIRCRTGPER